MAQLFLVERRVRPRPNASDGASAVRFNSIMVANSDIGTVELERVLVWRFEQLTEAGYTAEQAIELSAESTVDLHQAIELVRHGCPPDLAAKILS